MRIAHVVRQYHPSVGGMEDVVRNIARHQLESGHFPIVVTLDRVFRDDHAALPPDEEIDGVPVRRLAFRGSSRYPLCPQVLGALDGTDLIHVHGVDFFFDYLAATRWLHRRPMIASTHGGFFHTRFAEQFKRVFFHTVTRSSVRAYERIVATSDNDGQVFAPIVGRGQLEVIENGVDVRKFRRRAATQPVPVMIYFGRWSENKGIPLAIELLGRLRAREPDWRLIIAGREFDLDLAELRAIVAAHGIDAAVDLVPNPRDAELAELIGRASYFVCLSRHEGFGLAAIEALSAGLIPILSDIPPFRALVVRSGLGVLADAAGHDVLATRLFASRRDDAATWVALRERAIAFADTYDWREVAGRYLQVYEELEKR